MKIKIIILLIIISGVFACRKDKLTPPSDPECYSFEGPDDFFWTFGQERFQYKAPHFNPNSSNEFIYHYRDNEQNEFHLLKYNLQTQQKTLIVESGKIWYQPKWSTKGWIAYTHHVGYVDHIYIVKDNGDSLIQFTENTANLYPSWSSSGNELCWLHSQVLGVPYYFLRQNLNATSPPDTISKYGDAYNGYIRYNTISLNTNKLLSLVSINSTPHLATASLNEDPLSFTSIADMEQVFNSLSLSGLCWSTDENYVYVSIYANGLYKVNVNTSNTELLIPYCHSKRYESISASADGKYLIGERVNSYMTTYEDNNPTGQTMEASSIYLIDLQTLEETKIDLEP